MLLFAHKICTVTVKIYLSTNKSKLVEHDEMEYHCQFCDRKAIPTGRKIYETRRYMYAVTCFSCDVKNSISPLSWKPAIPWIAINYVSIYPFWNPPYLFMSIVISFLQPTWQWLVIMNIISHKSLYFQWFYQLHRFNKE